MLTRKAPSLKILLRTALAKEIHRRRPKPNSKRKTMSRMARWVSWDYLMELAGPQTLSIGVQLVNKEIHKGVEVGLKGVVTAYRQQEEVNPAGRPRMVLRRTALMAILTEGQCLLETGGLDLHLPQEPRHD